MVLKCLVKLTKTKFEEFAEAVTSFDADLGKELQNSAVIIESNVTVPADLVLRLKKQTSFCLHSFVNLSSFEIVNVAKPIEKNAKLAARLEKLRRQEEQRQYNELVANVTKTAEETADFGSIGTELRSLDRQIISVVNFVLTVAGAFVFGYKAPELLWGISDPLPRIIIGVICGAIVFIADIYFIIVRGA